MKKELTIGIIGVNGGYGKWLKKLFLGCGCKVIGSDIGTKITNAEVTKRADIVVFSVWPRATVKIIEEVVPYSRKDQLWLDVTSVKKDPVAAMLKSEASVAGLHPMCAPSVENWKGQTVVFCPSRLTKEWHKWLLGILTSSQAKIKIADPDEHDRTMTCVQGLPHASYLIMAAVLRKMDVDVSESLDFTSPIYRIGLSLIGRILAQDASLYSDIQMLNPNMDEMLKGLKSEVDNFERIVKAKDVDQFISEFQLGKDHFGEKNIEESYKYFEYIIKLITDLSKENIVIVKIKKDKPGVLKQITEIFNDHGINLTSFHSFKNGNGYDFHVGVDKKVDYKEVRTVLGIINKKFI